MNIEAKLQNVILDTIININEVVKEYLKELTKMFTNDN